MEQEKPKKPFGRSLSDFGVLKSGEWRLLDACEKGRLAKLGDKVPESPTEENCVRAEFLRFLLLGGDEQAPVHECGVQLQGAYVEDELDLSGCSITFDVSLINCYFPQNFYALSACMRGGLNLDGSYLVEGLGADRLECSSSVHLRNGFKATNTVRLLGALIRGNLSCHGGVFEVIEGAALSVDGAKVAGSVLLGRGFKANGSVRLSGIQINGLLDCGGGRFEVNGGDALAIYQANIGSSVYLNDGFKAIGAVQLVGARIGGSLSCSGAQIEVAVGEAWSADGAHVKGDVDLSNGFNAKGEVRLLGVVVGGCLNCGGGHFVANGNSAFSADRADIRGDAFFNRGFKSVGQVRLLGVQIGGNLSCNGGVFELIGSVPLLASGADIKGSVQLNQSFKASGEVKLDGIKIGGSLACDAGQFEVLSGTALSVVRSRINGSVFFNKNFEVNGIVSLQGAQINGNLFCDGAQFYVKDTDALCLETAIVRGVWHIYNLLQPLRINAAHADIGVLVDDVTAWAEGSNLDGLRYGAFGGFALTSGEARVAWLRGDLSVVEFRPQPWRQLQRVLREMGHAEDAKLVGIAFEKHLRKIGRVGLSAEGTNCIFSWWRRVTTRSVHGVFGLLAGYGYRPMRLVTWMLGVWLGCAGLYWLLAQQPYNALAPSDPLVFQNTSYVQCRSNELHTVHTVQAAQVAGQGNWPSCSLMPGEYSTFSPLAYSLDLLLPVVDLGQETAWGAYIPAADEGEARMPILNLPWGYLVRFLGWFEILFGWISSLILVATISGFSRRNDES